MASRERTSADRAHSAAREAAALAPPSLLESAPFREESLHVSDEWLKSVHPAIEVTVHQAKLTPGGHVERYVSCKRSYHDGELLVFEDRPVVYSPAREHESPASLQRRTMRFRKRERS